MATVTFDKATRLYPGSDKPAVDKLDLEIEDGEFLVLVGPSGCGKSTSLRMLAGLEDVNGGAILIGDRDVTHLPPKDRDIAMVFQNYALYPHMTVADNMGFALKIAGERKDEIRERVDEAAKILDLEQYLDRKPKALSGGQRQRVAMGRAIVRKPQVFLMDEPLSNLDAKLRVQTRTQIAALQRRLGVTTVYVTHDQVEAMTMGDRVAVLKDGLLQQVDTPRHMYDSPNNVFVAGFIGSPAMNLLQVAGRGRRAVRRRRRAVPRETAEVAGKAGRKSRSASVPRTWTGRRERGPEGDRQRRRGARRRRLRLRHRRRRRRGPTTSSPGWTAAGRRRRARRCTSPRSRATCTCSHRRPVSASPPDLPKPDVSPQSGDGGLTGPGAGRAPWRHGPAAAGCAERPGAARPAVDAPAGGVAGGPAGRAAPGHLPARRALRPARRDASTRSRRSASRSPCASTACCASSSGSTCPRSRRSAWSPAGSTTTASRSTRC